VSNCTGGPTPRTAWRESWPAVPLPADAFRTGPVDVLLAVPAGSAPSFDGAGLEITYVIRALVDRRLRSDAAIERPVAIV